MHLIHLKFLAHLNIPKNPRCQMYLNSPKIPRYQTDLNNLPVRQFPKDLSNQMFLTMQKYPMLQMWKFQIYPKLQIDLIIPNPNNLIFLKYPRFQTDQTDLNIPNILIPRIHPLTQFEYFQERPLLDQP